MSESDHRLSCSNYVHFGQRIFIGVTFCSYQYLESSKYNVCYDLCGKQSKNKTAHGTQFFWRCWHWSTHYWPVAFPFYLCTFHVEYWPCMSSKCHGPGPRQFHIILTTSPKNSSMWTQLTGTAYLDLKRSPSCLKRRRISIMVAHTIALLVWEWQVATCML